MGTDRADTGNFLIQFLIKILSWNIRGLGSNLKKRFVNELIKSRKPDIMFVQETKIEIMHTDWVERMWDNNNMDFMFVEAESASGGLVTMWNRDCFSF